ncbi:pleiotropic drug resistance protein 1-like isoform X11 [Quercus robur]|uniref:pleiotropic drug resistance protein 1-like isoform X11 n=1 Tax=Quercus robur TaxID=38942 RepID=UPI0021632D0A|nr:pleiotropic drug resistance protein 1-like isoform X11 [Quercus robur]
MEVFSSSSREEVGEKSLKWAAIQRLPTGHRLRRGILTAENGEAKEVDIRSLDEQQLKNLLGKLLNQDEDNEKFLMKLKDRFVQVGIEFPKIEVRMERLNVDTEAYIGSRALPTLYHFTINFFEGLLNSCHIIKGKKKPFSILHDVSGIIKPGRTTLLLGPPGSGKTTLLLAMAGRLSSDVKLSGRVTYNGHGMDDFIPQRTSAYISQHDEHIGEMTVRETLAFSARCQGVGPRYEMLAELSRREKEANIKPDSDIDIFLKSLSLEGQKANVLTDYVIKILGLEICADIMVGDEMRRGISGGQRKRVTVGEMLVGPARALFMDEISTGLDSSTTFQIVNSIRQAIHILEGTAVISLLQPAPETYELFEDIILLSEGQVVYQGPRENALEFFESMGFKCPERKGEADFLQEVTSRNDQEQYWANKDIPYAYVTVKEFADAFKSFHIGQKLGDELAIPFDEAKNHPAALTTTKYGVGKKELLKACISRELLLMQRGSAYYIFKMVQVFLMALLMISLYVKTKKHRHTTMGAQIVMGALFFTMATIMFNGFAELALTIMKLPVFYKHRDLLFFPPWSYALPIWILKIPITIVEAAIWVSMTYYVVGFEEDFTRFLKQFLLLFCVTQMASGLFRFIAALGRNMIIANTFGSFGLLLLIVLGGFVLSKNEIKKWWEWGYWVSPVMYGQNAIAVNEFLGKSWKRALPNTTEPLGLVVLKSHGLFREEYWFWIGVGASIGFVFLFNFLFILALTYLNPFGKPQAVLSEETLVEKHSDGKENPVEKHWDRKEKDIELSHNEKTSSARSGRNLFNQNKKKGMVLPFEPLSITFDDISYAVDMPQEMKSEGVTQNRLTLLKGLSGAFRPGVLTALMGVSGAGKSTLMDVLAGRKTGGYIEGSIMISGYPKKQETFARIAGYCEQNDIHSPHITVYESLFYSAWLRLAPEVDITTKKMFVEEVMDLVELNSIRESIVGSPNVNGLSTEQRKRLTIATELVANPSIIFMDEPTSGLDARAAAIVMRTVRNTVDTGRTVVCTIHQPSIDIFDAFDELYLLKSGGQEIYVGPIGHRASHLISYFEGIRGVKKIRDGINPATWMLEVTTAAQEAVLGVNFSDVYNNSELYRRNKVMVKELSKPQPMSKDLHFATQFSQSFWTQCKACLWKQHWSYWRNPQYNAVRLLFSIFIALIFGSMFWDLGPKRIRQQDIFNSVGSMYVASLFIGIQNAALVQPVVAVERTVFYRERAAGMYSALPYAIAQITIEIPYIFIQAVIYAPIVYFMIGFETTASKFFLNFFFMYFTFLYFTFFGMLTVAITPNYSIAAVVSVFFYALWNLFSGFLITRLFMPVWWIWFYWACPFAWTLYGLICAQFGDSKDRLDTGLTVEELMKSYFGFKTDFLGVVSIVIIGITLLFGVGFALAIKVLNFQGR